MPDVEGTGRTTPHAPGSLLVCYYPSSLVRLSSRVTIKVACALVGASALIVSACGGGAAKVPTPALTPSPAQHSYDLRLAVQSCDSDQASGNVVVTGAVRNVSGVILDGISAIAVFLNPQGVQLDQSEAPLVPSSLAVDAAGNFRVAAKNTPDIERCIVRFTANGRDLNVDFSAVPPPPTETPP